MPIDGYDVTHMEEIHFIKLVSFELLIILNNVEDKTNSKFKVITMCLIKNADKISTALVVFSLIILATFSVFLLKLSPKTNINYNKIVHILKRAKKTPN